MDNFIWQVNDYRSYARNSSNCEKIKKKRKNGLNVISIDDFCDTGAVLVPD